MFFLLNELDEKKQFSRENKFYFHNIFGGYLERERERIIDLKLKLTVIIFVFSF